MSETKAELIESTEPAAAETKWPTHLQTLEEQFNALLALLVTKTTISQGEADTLTVTTLNDS